MGGAGGGVFLFGCNGAIFLRVTFDALASGLCVGEGDASGEFTFELTLRIRADMDDFRCTARGVEELSFGGGGAAEISDCFSAGCCGSFSLKYMSV